eukprot:1089121-Pleurochrysis_carterae.AAC.1
MDTVTMRGERRGEERHSGAVAVEGFVEGSSACLVVLVGCDAHVERVTAEESQVLLVGAREEGGDG